jgi:hypothetical protein
MWAATDRGVHADDISSGSTVNPWSSMATRTPPAAWVGRALAAAFGDLRGVPCRPGWTPSPQRKGCDESGIGGASGDDHVGVLLERGDDWFCAHESDDMVAALQDGSVEWSGRGQR